MSQRIKVYVAGPYTQGDVAVNVRAAILAADRLMGLGFAPFVPHLTHFWHLVAPRPYEDWLDLDNQFLPHCDALLRLPGVSAGAEREVALAESLGIPVFHNLKKLAAAFAGRSGGPGKGGSRDG
jgi:hypothetical protein